MARYHSPDGAGAAGLVRRGVAGGSCQRSAPFPYRVVAVPGAVVGDVAALQPDLICLTGDYITICDRTSWDGYQEVLGGFAATAPTYAVLGNHDGGYWAGAYGGLSSTGTVAGLLDGAGIEVLENRSVVINHRGRRIRLTGVGDWMNGACRPCEAFAGVAPGPGELGLALSHNPDSKDALLPHPFHLLLCGHTHGGQIGFVPLARLFVHLEDKRYIAGLYRYQGRWLHISRGVGNLHGLRIGCRPEVTLLEIG